MNNETFLNTPLDNAGEQLNALLGSKGLRLAADATVRHGIHAMKRAGLTPRETVQTLLMVGVFDPFIAWVDTVEVTLTDMDTKVTHVEPMIPATVAVNDIKVVCVDCNGEKGEAIYRITNPQGSELPDDPTAGMCAADYIEFMTDAQRTVEECNELNDTLVLLDAE
jgi:hypothetical protein